MFTHHIDCGDTVIVINTDKLVATGNKLTDKNIIDILAILVDLRLLLCKKKLIKIQLMSFV